jgi:hypothetical protein
MTDIDIDFADPDAALAGVQHVRAILPHGVRQKHSTGVYFHDIPAHPLDGMAVWDHKEAGRRGYFKIDFLHNTIYDHIRDEAHLQRLLDTEPPWEAFEDPLIVQQLAQINKPHAVAVVCAIKPKCIEDLAVCVALIRPGKRHLIGRSRPEIDREIWQPPATGADDEEGDYVFKHSHAVAYAASIVVQLNLMLEQVDD